MNNDNDNDMYKDTRSWSKIFGNWNNEKKHMRLMEKNTIEQRCYRVLYAMKNAGFHGITDKLNDTRFFDSTTARDEYYEI